MTIDRNSSRNWKALEMQRFLRLCFVADELPARALGRARSSPTGSTLRRGDQLMPEWPCSAGVRCHADSKSPVEGPTRSEVLAW